MPWQKMGESESLWAAATRCHRLGGLGTTETSVLEAGRLRSGCQLGRVLGKVLFPAHSRHLLITSFTGKGRGSSLGLIFKDTNPTYEAPTLMT